MKRLDLLRHLQAHGCVLKREGGSHSIWHHPGTKHMQAVPRHNEIGNSMARKICRALFIPLP
jgi:mRNA interferase HicA